VLMGAHWVISTSVLTARQHASGNDSVSAHQHGPCWRVMETGHPSTRAVNSGSGNRALVLQQYLSAADKATHKEEHISTHRSSGVSTQNIRSTTVVICRPRIMNTFGFGFSSLISWHSTARKPGLQCIEYSLFLFYSARYYGKNTPKEN